MKSIIYEKEVLFTYSDCDANDNLTPKSILQACQDAAGEHADIMHIGYEELLAKRLIWVIDRTRFHIEKPFNPFEPLVLKTWPLRSKTIEFNREYVFENAAGQRVITATSKWCIVNIDTRRLVRMRDIQMPQEGYIEDYAIEEDPYKMIVPFDHDDLKPVYDIPIRFSELDHNGHMNNTNYACLASDSIPNISSKRIVDMQLNFMKECQQSDRLETYVNKIGENEYSVIGLKNKKDVSFMADIILEDIKKC